MSDPCVTDVTATTHTCRFQRLVKMSCMMGYKLVYGNIHNFNLFSLEVRCREIYNKEVTILNYLDCY